MPFFLIGRGPDDDLRLLSAKALETRQDAMAELSALSADPAFDQWDAEVSVMNLDTGVPVLLVRPASGAATAPVSTLAETGDAEAWEADLPVTAEAPASEQAAAVKEETPEPAWAPPLVPAADVAVADPAIADAIIEEAEASESAGELEEVTAAGEPPAQDSAVDENDELRAAILRTTQHMTAEGIVPPESVGGGPEPEVAAASEDLAAAAVTDTAAPEGATAEPHAAAWPWDTSAETAETEAGVAPEVAGVYDALQEPAQELPEPDVEAVLRRPVMMGSYDEETDASAEPLAPDANAPMSMGSAEEAATTEVPDDVSDFILDLDTIQPASVHDAEVSNPAESPAEPTAVEAEPAAEIATDEAATPESETKADSASEVAAAETPQTEVEAESDNPDNSEATDGAAAAAEAVSPLQDYTCQDCVYVDTCPNSDQRLPKDCGSFQWR